jgi:hypothetical protein
MRLVHLLAAVVLVTSVPAHALLLTVSSTGTATSVDPPLPFSQGAIGTGSFQIESTTPDDLPGARAGRYHSPVNFSITIGGYTASSAGGTSQGFILIHDATPSATAADLYTAEAYGVSGATLLGYYVPTRVTFILNDQNATAFSSDALPASLDLADFSYGVASIRFEVPEGRALSPTPRCCSPR